MKKIGLAALWALDVVRAVLRAVFWAFVAVGGCILLESALSGCTLTERTTSFDGDGKVTAMRLRQLSVVQYPPDAANVQATDAAAFYLATPVGLVLGIGGFSNLTAPANADLEIAGGVDVGADGATTHASRLIRTGQLYDGPPIYAEKPTTLNRLKELMGLN